MGDQSSYKDVADGKMARTFSSRTNRTCTSLTSPHPDTRVHPRRQPQSLTRAPIFQFEKNHDSLINYRADLPTTQSSSCHALVQSSIISIVNYAPICASLSNRFHINTTKLYSSSSQAVHLAKEKTVNKCFA